jgi:hypothetical protein
MKQGIRAALAASTLVLTSAGANAGVSAATRQALLRQAHQEAAGISLPAGGVGGLLGGLLGGGSNLSATGDADSFGRPARFIGVAQSGFVQLSNDCTPDPSSPPGPDDRCFVVTPTPGVVSSFQATDIGRLTLPANSAHSLICPLFTISMYQSLINPSASAALGLFQFEVSLTFESTVLSDPRAVDPTTHAPYNGELTVAYSGATTNTTLQPAAVDVRQQAYTRGCIAGINKQALIQSYGLPSDLAEKFFQQPMTVHLNLPAGSASLVDFGYVYYGARLLGD